jgi:hypothetical protein
MRILELAVISLLLYSLLPAASAYFNVTSLSTTVYLSNGTSARVSEVLNVYVSNSSINQYIRDRDAINLTTNGWQSALSTTLLTEHILNPKGSISNLTFLPGPLSYSGNGAYAQLTLNYYSSNVTNVTEIAPRKFEYSVNSTVFNFEHAASGEILFPNSRLTIVVPSGSQLISVNPLPDYPYNFTNATQFSWYKGEPLSKFTFVYVITESLQQEVTSFFSSIYNTYEPEIYLSILLAIAALAMYAYIKTRRE